MASELPLQGETILLTGTNVTRAVAEQIERLGGHAVHVPLLTIEEVISETDFEQLQQCSTYDWLIFTSQHAVYAFREKMKRADFCASSLQVKVAAVGDKTAGALEELGLSVDFVPSVFSADVFVKEFPNQLNMGERCLFLKGSLARKTIAEGLPCEVDEWCVYETVQTEKHVDEILHLLAGQEHTTVTFASPSAVQVFHEKIASVVGWTHFWVAAIGHITEAALTEVGAPIHVKPNIYTMQALVEQIVRKKVQQS